MAGVAPGVGGETRGDGLLVLPGDVGPGVAQDAIVGVETRLRRFTREEIGPILIARLSIADLVKEHRTVPDSVEGEGVTENQGGSGTGEAGGEANVAWSC